MTVRDWLAVLAVGTWAGTITGWLAGFLPFVVVLLMTGLLGWFTWLEIQDS